MAETRTVWVLSIDHRHGTEITPYGSEAAAQAALHGYVVQSWDDLVERDEATPPEPPDDPDEAVEHYFEAAAEWEYVESYRLEQHEVAFDA